MGAFDNLMSGVAGVPASDGADPVEKSTRPPGDLNGDMPVWAQKALTRGLQQVEDSPGYVQKQDARRRAQLPEALRETVEDTDSVAKKPYDPVLLRDLASSTIPQTYTDTLAQDLASANWRLRARDDDADVADETIAEAERKLRNLVPDSTFSEFLEETARTLLRLGDATIVKHYPGGDPTNPVAEAVHVDSATMFKKLDEGGFPAGYVQFTGTTTERGQEFDGTDLVLDEVLWISWARRGNHVYGEGPVEKGRETIEVLEEIAEKELLDLIQGMPPGVISRPLDAEVPVDSADWENFKDDMRLNEGERHRLGYANFPVDYQALTPNYQELQLLDRYTTKVTELGGVYKVNPSYAGFDFENVNRATDESQQAAYKQRGFKVLTTRVEEALTLGLVPDLLRALDVDGDTTLVFEFEKETTVEERETRAKAQQEAITAGKEAADAGLDVAWRDGEAVIENGDMEAGNVGGGGGGGGLFGSVERPDALEKDDVTVLGFPVGGIAHSGDNKTWGDFMNALLDRGAEKIVDLKAQRNGRERAYPEDELPDPHDSLIAVHGLPGGVVRDILSAHEEIHLSYIDPSSKGESDTKNADREGGESTPSPLSKEEVEKLNEILFRSFEEQIVPESVDAIQKRAFSSSDVPDYVLEKIREALDDGAVFDAIESAGERVEQVADDITEILEDNLLDEGGWTLGDITDDLNEKFPNLSEGEAETIARTETSSTLNTAREKGYEERDDAATLRFKWVGPDDSRETDACERLKGETDPDRGGNPLPMPELKRLEREIANEEFPNLSYREHVVHPNERHTFRRVLPAETGAA